jgi:hypothetical protein
LVLVDDESSHGSSKSTMDKMAILMDKMILQSRRLDFANGEINLATIA